MDSSSSSAVLPPPLSHFSTSILAFLNSKLCPSPHLNEAPTFISELQAQCTDLGQTLTNLNLGLAAYLLTYAFVSDQAHAFLDLKASQLTSLASSTRSLAASGFEGTISLQ